MHWNPDDFSEYGETPQSGAAPGKIEYSDPAYYHQDAPSAPPSALPVQSPAVESYADYANGPTVVNASAMMSEYRGPAAMEGYTADVGAEQRDAATHGKLETGKKRKGLARLGGIGATIAALLLNFKWIAFVAKFGWAGFSALFSIAVYSLFFGWPFAVGIVALLFIHEMGHALVMKLKGIPVGGLIFVPLLGAAVFMRQMPKNAQDEAEVGIAGPVAGAIAAGGCLAFAGMSPHASRIWAAWGFLALLLFQIGQGINGFFSIWLLFFLLIAASQLWGRRAMPQSAAAQAYYNVPIGSRIALSVLYFGLAAVLVLGMSISHGLIMPIVH